MLEYPADIIETETGDARTTHVVATDEVGRGALAFDVCAAAVILPRRTPQLLEAHAKELEDVRDSKSMSEKKRDRIATFIKSFAVAWAVGSASPKEIDDVNILNATHLAMHRAIEGVETKLRERGDERIGHIAVDGDRFKHYASLLSPEWIPHRCHPGGDATRLDIAAASIIAKTHRDALVGEACRLDPSLNERYGFAKNKAYGTAQHMDGLKTFGPTDHHRRSYAPVAASVAASWVRSPDLSTNRQI
jgi:ribonuclease HII